MASLCDDTGQGRVSRKAVEILENHAAWKAQNREKRARMKTLMEQKKYGREEGDDVIDADQIPSNPGEAGPSAQVPPKPSNPAASTHLDDSGGGFDYSQDLATSRFNVQVRIGPNGETIIDEASLVVDRAEAEDTENYTHVVESDHTKFVNSGSYGKRFRGSRWSAEETESFYDVSQSREAEYTGPDFYPSRLSPSMARIMNSLRMCYQVVIGNRVKTNSKLRTRRIPHVSTIACGTPFQLVRVSLLLLEVPS
jgi:transcription factor TFIIIB component B''